ncbi:uncharacterized protein LOC125233493 [Leguminivora glycinivorella]|uniref:uncharacterized protein LOC125233493 n=1 Tax=Leguminivora glycinivorella TaxID=1035111 RepID=UPI00200F79EE|nr:uncharacterized protein LOC125233493 [Leguminivora glycinivorella]
MGKRRFSGDEEYYARKIRKLEHKMEKIRRERREESSDSEWSSESSDAIQYDEELVNELADHHVSEQEVPRTEGPQEENQPSPVIDPQLEITPELDPSILNILGDEPAKEEVFSKAVHKDIASRWSDILINGLKDDVKKEIISCHDIPENLTLLQSPILNPEIKAAVNENALKRDVILSEKQRSMACVLTCIADLMSSNLENSSDTAENKGSLKLLSDTGRLLCHVHYEESLARRNFLQACLSKDVKENIKDLKRDKFLFGTDLSEKLKSMKAITKTGAEMRPASTKPKPQPRSRPAEAGPSRALNWRGPPPPAPRRAYARTSSTAGGRRQPAATATPRSARREPRPRSSRPATSRR